MCISFTTFVQFNLKVSVQQRMLSTMNMFNCYTYEKTYKSVKKKLWNSWNFKRENSV